MLSYSYDTFKNLGSVAVQQPVARAAAIYVRISDDRAGDALGVARQLDLCRSLAAEKGWAVAEVYVDNDVSAYSGKPRPSYERLLRDIEDGLRDAVVTVDLDRLTRRPAELEEFIALADRKGLALANVSGDTDLSTSDGRFRARILGSVARHESEKKSERIRRQRDQAATRGTALGGPRPFGYQADAQGAWVVVHAEEAAAIRDAVQRVLSGESFRSVAMRWNLEGRRTARGKEWSTNSVRVVLTGPRIAGLRQHRGEVVGKAVWPAIITRAQHEQLLKRATTRKQPRGRHPEYLLTKIATCGRHGCGVGLRTGYRGDPRRTRAYICKRDPGVHHGCGRLSMAAEPLDEFVREVVLEAIAGPELQAAMERSTPHRRADDALADQISALEERLAQLATDHYVDGMLTRAEFFAARDAAHARLNEMREELTSRGGTALLSQLPTDPALLRALWDKESLEWRRTLLTTVLHCVEISPGKPGRRGFDASRVRFVWRA
jgi:site-specific DNA recombinase